jgi:RNA polymerase-binding transcription factor DksA
MSTAADILGSKPRSRVSPKWAPHFQSLLDERDRLLARDFSSDAPGTVKMDDLSDAATDEAQRTLSFVGAGARQEALFEVLEAIHRAECGTYGVCEATGEPIEDERLQAIPWARFSLRGQQQMEAGGSGRRRGIPALQSSFEDELTAEPEIESAEREQAA